ncbi:MULTISPECIES: Mor transcription activator family protein [Vibrio]|uniref:Mor transcription activator family protein n=1 Tax=Vibrio TaxID=662 RepID=UPI0020BF0978|nr:Mor transcription activator family protein [Vibrio sp. J383]UQV23637.1 transcriptional regulator [Vibrio sp. J383]UQV24815.1 transcriptional regulator [Vibrio sp. J383]
MQLTNEQHQHAVSLLSPSSRVMLQCLEEAINNKKNKPDALSILIDITEKVGGSIDYVARGRKLQAYLRNIALVNDYQSGMTVNQLSKKYNLAYNTVYTAIRKSNIKKG